MSDDRTTASTPMRFDDPHDDIGSNPNPTRPIAEVIAARLSRRGFLAGAASAVAIAATGAAEIAGRAAQAQTQATTAPAQPLGFAEVARGSDPDHKVAAGYDARVLVRWGDAVVADAPAFDPASLSARAQQMQFGYNCDFVGFVSLPQGSNASDHGLLCVNHEYTNTDFMWSGLRNDNITERMTRDMVEVEFAAHGVSIVEVQKQGETWSMVRGGRYNRRISLLTEVAISGPAAGHDRLKTAADPTGRKVMGTLNNCSGGMTPWGTMLTAEENFHQYFSGQPTGREQQNYTRYGIAGRPSYPWWGRHVDRFDIAKEPNEPNRFGWVVEIDPYEPGSQPVKRTALGRIKHEAANTVVAPDGRVVVYTGDDERFDYIYKFVTAGRYNPNDRAANRNLLDEGTLYVAKFEDDGRLEWLPLVHGQGPLTAANGFASQADVLIETRRAADLIGATPMDRPEDVDINPRTGTVYAMLTNNTNRKPANDEAVRARVNAPNPRANNAFGHVLAMQPPRAGQGFDHAATAFTWTVPILCGKPDGSTAGVKYGEGTTPDGMFAAPDNVAFDSQGRMWIATDQGDSWRQLSGNSDGIFAMQVEGPQAFVSKRFYSVPIGAEMCGPCFTPDSTTFFIAVQHPATDGVENSNFDTPATRWPDFRDGVPPRPSVVAITKRGGGTIGS